MWPQTLYTVFAVIVIYEPQRSGWTPQGNLTNFATFAIEHDDDDDNVIRKRTHAHSHRCRRAAVNSRNTEVRRRRRYTQNKCATTVRHTRLSLLDGYHRTDTTVTGVAASSVGKLHTSTRPNATRACALATRRRAARSL